MAVDAPLRRSHGNCTDLLPDAPRRGSGLRVAACAVALLAGPHCLAGEVVFGSFRSPDAAEQFRLRVEQLQPSVEIVAVDVGGAPHHRVVATFDTESDAKDALAAARAAGFPDAWFLPDVRAVATQGAGDDRSGNGAFDAPSQDTAQVGEQEPASGPAARIEPMPSTGFVPIGSRLRFSVSVDSDETVEVPRYEAVDIRLDGRLDEAVWDEVPAHDQMVLVDPDTLEPARHGTVMRFLYTHEGLYLGVWNEQPSSSLMPRLASEDAAAYRDGWGITLDTSGEGRFGSWYNVDLRRPAPTDGGSASDSLPGARLDWSSATAELRDGWSLEAFLPWSRVSLPPVDGDRVMGMYAHRRVAYLGERWGWPATLTPGRGS